MELRHLRYFEAIARHQHVTRAARELHIAQPSLSKQLRALETELGVALFSRVGRRLEITDAGELLLPYARRILREVADAEQMFQQRAALDVGRVSIGSPPTVGTHLLPRALADFNGRYRGIQLELHEAGAGRLLQLLAQGTVDLAVVSLPVDDVACAELFSEELVVAVSEQHPLAERKTIRGAELAEHDFILFPQGYELRERTLAFCRAAGFEPRIVLDGGEMDTVLRFAAVGLGVTIVPQLALEGTEGLVAIRISDVSLARTLGLIWRRERDLSPAATALRQFLIARLRA